MMLTGKSTISSAPAKIVTVLLALALVVTPALCCCLVLQGQAMAASMPAPMITMDMEDCNGHSARDVPSDHHETTSNPASSCHDTECEDCSYASASEGVKADRFVEAASPSSSLAVLTISSETVIAPIARLIASVHPRRGPPPFVPTTLVSLQTLLLT